MTKREIKIAILAFAIGLSSSVLTNFIMGVMFR